MSAGSDLETLFANLTEVFDNNNPDDWPLNVKLAALHWTQQLTDLASGFNADISDAICATHHEPESYGWVAEIEETEAWRGYRQDALRQDVRIALMQWVETNPVGDPIAHLTDLQPVNGNMRIGVLKETFMLDPEDYATKTVTRKAKIVRTP